MRSYTARNRKDHIASMMALFSIFHCSEEWGWYMYCSALKFGISNLVALSLTFGHLAFTHWDDWSHSLDDATELWSWGKRFHLDKSAKIVLSLAPLSLHGIVQLAPWPKEPKTVHDTQRMKEIDCHTHCSKDTWHWRDSNLECGRSQL